MNKFRKLLKDEKKAAKHYFMTTTKIPRNEDIDSYQIENKMRYKKMKDRNKMHGHSKFPKGKLET